jgi:hypothetical protein
LGLVWLAAVPANAAPHCTPKGYPGPKRLLCCIRMHCRSAPRGDVHPRRYFALNRQVSKAASAYTAVSAMERTPPNPEGALAAYAQAAARQAQAGPSRGYTARPGDARKHAHRCAQDALTGGEECLPATPAGPAAGSYRVDAAKVLHGSYRCGCGLLLSAESECWCCTYYDCCYALSFICSYYPHYQVLLLKRSTL